MGEIVLQAVFATDGLGFVLCLMLILGNIWRFRSKTRENKILCRMLISAMLICLIDPCTYFLDGKPGSAIRIAVVLGNTWLYSANIIVGYSWICLLTEHLNHKMGPVNLWLVRSVSSVGILLLLANLFYPLVFLINDDNVYIRGPVYWFYATIQVFYMMDSLFIYISHYRHTRLMKIFPIWLYFVPLITGLVLQTFVYGIAVVGPFLTISVGGILTGLQNEHIFKDKLTGLYNRYYLDYMNKSRKKRNNFRYCIMMLDLNGFKSINDRFGHRAGDEALVTTGNLLNLVVGSDGTVIRYAGDEFIIVLNTDDVEEAERYAKKIRATFNGYNATEGKPYRLSAGIGHCPVDLRERSADEWINYVDHLMYRDKKESRTSDATV